MNSIRSLAFVNSFAGFLLCTQQVVLFFPVSENEFHRKLRYLIEVWFIGSSSNAVFSGGELVGEVLYLSEVLNFAFFLLLFFLCFSSHVSRCDLIMVAWWRLLVNSLSLFR